MNSDELKYMYSMETFKLTYESRKSVENKIISHLNSLLLTESVILVFLGIAAVNIKEINPFVLILLTIALLIITLSSCWIIRASISSKTVLPNPDLVNLKCANISEALIDELNKSSIDMRIEIGTIIRSLKIYEYSIIISIVLIFLSVVICVCDIYLSDAFGG